MALLGAALLMGYMCQVIGVFTKLFLEKTTTKREFWLGFIPGSPVYYSYKKLS